MTLMLFEPLNRGEIILSHERLLELNAQLEQFHFRFQVLDHSHSAKKAPKLDPVLEPKAKRKTTFNLKSDWSDVVYGDGDEINFNKRPTRVRKQPLAFIEEFYDEATVAPTKRSERHHHDHQHQQQQNHHQHRRQHDHHHHHHKMGKSSSASLYKTVSNILKTLPKLQKDTWEYTCYRILQVVKYMDTDKWFWYPVDPVADGVPNYLKVIKHPMDFQTVIERLHKGHYTNPFQWQTDMRQIFYNAFTFYKSDNIIWQAALRVCTQFEAKLANTRFVNCDEFAELLTLAPDTAKTALLNYNEETFARKGAPSRKGRDALDDVVEVLGKRRGARKSYEFDYGGVGDGVGDGGDDQGSEYDDASYMGSSDDQNSPDEYISMDHYNGRNKRMGNRRIGGSRQGYMFAAGPIPAVGHVPPPPPFQSVGINDKSLSSAQQRTLDYNLTRLAPNQRKAALELVEDDLGILAELFKDDQTFTFDACLLPIEKQRRIFLYVNQMARRNEGIMHAQAVAGASMAKRSGAKRRFASGRGVAAGGDDEDGDGDDEDEDDVDDDDIDAEVDLDDADYDEDDLIVDGHSKRDGRRLPVPVQVPVDHRRRAQGKGKGKGKGYGQVFDDDSSSSLSDVASNFLSSDEFFSSSEDEAKHPNEKQSKSGPANPDSHPPENDPLVNGNLESVVSAAATAPSVTDDSVATTTTTELTSKILESPAAVESAASSVTRRLNSNDPPNEVASSAPVPAPGPVAVAAADKSQKTASTGKSDEVQAKGKRGKKGKSVAHLPEYRPVDDDEEVTLASSLSRRLVASSVEFLDKEKGDLSIAEADEEKIIAIPRDDASPHPKRRAVEPKASAAAAKGDADVALDSQHNKLGKLDEFQEESPRIKRAAKDGELTRVRLAAVDVAGGGTGRRACVDKDNENNASATGNNNADVKQGAVDGKDESKSSAWMEWKGQVIHHGIVAQQNGVAPRNDDEKIAEGYDARI